ncbi:alpha/beta hydrolase family protein [Puia sp. P3]|uniref:alpha/beta hydrolase family protein n=1 Tax=Puia sp. P3 TaxID=3423952 RepID=UPI003D66415D
MTSELVKWNQLDGTTTQGILYKPENFDPHKKYPVIVHYYEQMSHRLYEYPSPGFSDGEPNIAWFVSRGYLVLTPDIYYINGIVGKSAENTVVSAAQYLAGLPYVDSKRMAIAGHSYAGHETNYLLTHTDLFAAALSSAGCSDAVSQYLSLSLNGSSSYFMGDIESRMGVSPSGRTRRGISTNLLFF